MKIISLCPSNTELCVYLGVENQLIALDDYSDWPESVQHLPRLGPDLSINIDLVEKLQPDLVLASLSVPGMEKNIKDLQDRGIPHLTFNPQSLDDIAKDLLTLGDALGMEKRASEAVRTYRSRLQQFEDTAKRIEHKAALYWEWWPNPLFSPGGVNWLTEISRLAGGYNIFETVDLASIQVPFEDVRKLDPAYILLAWVGVPTSRIKPELVKKRPGWKEMKAVQQDQVLILEEPLYCRPSPRLLDGLEKLALILHPLHYQYLTDKPLESHPKQV